jgi:hypothetical protein
VKCDLFVVLGRGRFLQGLPRSSHDEEPVLRIRDEMKKILGQIPLMCVCCGTGSPRGVTYCTATNSRGRLVSDIKKQSSGRRRYSVVQKEVGFLFGGVEARSPSTDRRAKIRRRLASSQAPRWGLEGESPLDSAPDIPLAAKEGVYTGY